MWPNDQLANIAREVASNTEDTIVEVIMETPSALDIAHSRKARLWRDNQPWNDVPHYVRLISIPVIQVKVTGYDAVRALLARRHANHAGS